MYPRFTRILMTAVLVLLATAPSAVLGTTPVSATKLPSYAYTDLGTLGGSNSHATDINSLGQVAGYSDTTNNASVDPVVWTPATRRGSASLQDLGTLGGTDGKAYALNDAGQVVGYSTTTDGPFHAFLFSGGTMQDLGTLGGTTSTATGINSIGTVVGYSMTGTTYQRAFLYSGGTMHDLGALDGTHSSAYALNDAGQVAGASRIGQTDAWGNPIVHAVLWTPATRRLPASVQDLGTLGGNNSGAVAINRVGQVAGNSDEAQYANGNPVARTFLWTPARKGAVSTMQNLGTLGGDYSEAFGMNDLGQVVGTSYPAVHPTDHAFLYSDGTMSDLNTLVPSLPTGVTLERATGINTRGWITGDAIVGYDATSTPIYHAFLLTPNTPTTTPTPTPMVSGNITIHKLVCSTLGIQNACIADTTQSGRSVTFTVYTSDGQGTQGTVCGVASLTISGNAATGTASCTAVLAQYYLACETTDTFSSTYVITPRPDLSLGGSFQAVGSCINFQSINNTPVLLLEFVDVKSG